MEYCQLRREELWDNYCMGAMTAEAMRRAIPHSQESLKGVWPLRDQPKDGGKMAQTGACNGWSAWGRSKSAQNARLRPIMSFIDSGGRASVSIHTPLGSLREAFRVGFNLEKMHRQAAPYPLK
jgi:hypothetical protein